MTTLTRKKPIAQQGKRYQFDLLVIGSGIAGLCAILEFAQLHPTRSIALITKKELSECNSYYAQGGIAAVSQPEDSIEQHFEDTLAAGDNLSYAETAKAILNYGPEAIQQLIKYGVKFTPNDLAQEGGHSKRRIHHAGDHTGQAIIDVLIHAIKKLPRVKIFESHTAVNLITANDPHQPGNYPEVLGAYILNEKQQKIHTFLAQATLLATGGAGKVYRYTTNLEVATGDGIAMAYRAGARVGNLEFYQFHPTLLFHHECNNFLISEAVRGEDAHLLNPDTLERFMSHYAPDKMELATRDIVARAIFNEIEHSEKNFVYLDIRHQSKPFLKKRFPTIYTTLLKLGIDMSKDLIPVVPAAHYLCGGILTDISGKTDLKRLYAIGETAFTGLHGANRLASNSLLEGVVMAHYAAKACNEWLDQPLKNTRAIKDWSSQSVTDLRRASQINAHWRGLRGEMTSYAGIIRTAAGLKDLLKLITVRREMIEEYYWKHAITRELIELRNIILVAELIVRSALKRHESRGGHYREDYPKKLSRRKESIIRPGITEPIFE